MEEVCSILTEAGFDEATVEIFRSNKIDRTVLMNLDKDDMKELGITALGDRKRLQSIISKLTSQSNSPTGTTVLAMTRSYFLEVHGIYRFPQVLDQLLAVI